MIERDAFTQYLNSLLRYPGHPDPAIADPQMGNDLQFQGKETIQKVGFGVSASLKLFELAVEQHCDAVITHHGLLFPAPDEQGYDPSHLKRMAFLELHQLNFYGYHVLLDVHPTLGNNAQLLQLLGITEQHTLGHNDFLQWGYYGDLPEAKTLSEIVQILTPYFSPHTYVYDGGPERIRRVAALLGSGAPFGAMLGEIIDDGIECYITGNPRESSRELMRETGISMIAGGHYNTEMFGVKALMEQVRNDHDVEVVFLDLPNEV